jgi:hypothetical protein
MTTSQTRASRPPVDSAAQARQPLYASLVGLASLAIWLQGLWAGLFIREGEDFDASSSQAGFVEVWRLRSRKDLVIGTGALVVLLVLEAYIGGEIGAHSGWPSLHVPLAMALMALSVWLPLRARGVVRTR